MINLVDVIILASCLMETPQTHGAPVVSMTLKIGGEVQVFLVNYLHLCLNLHLSLLLHLLVQHLNQNGNAHHRDHVIGSKSCQIALKSTQKKIKSFRISRTFMMRENVAMGVFIALLMG